MNDYERYSKQIKENKMKKNINPYLDKNFLESLSKIKFEDFEKLYLISPNKLENDFITIEQIISIINGSDCRIRQFDLNTFYCVDNMGINFNVNKHELSNRCLSFIINKGFDVNISIKKSNNFMPCIQLFVYGHEIFEEFGNCQSEIVFNAFRFAYIQSKPK